MANRGVCSKHIEINGEKVSFSTHRFFALSSDGKVFRLRHYRDLLRTGVFSGERPAGNFISSNGPDDAVSVLALDKKDPMPSLDEIRLLLDWTERGPGGFVASFRSKKNEIGMPGAILGSTRDARRATNVKMPEGRIELGEGGWGHRRSPANELLMLARSDRSADSYYESAKERGERRRRLVSTMVRRDPAALSVLVRELRSKDNLRTPALLIAVDALVAGHPDGERMLTDALRRPDQPGQALRYFFDAYRDGARGGIPSTLRRAIAAAASNLYTEDAVLRFDRVRTIGVEDRSVRGSAVRFSDVIALTHPVPNGAEQSQLFGFLVGSAEPTPLLAVRERLAALPPDLVVNELEREADRLSRGGSPGLISRLPWELLATLSAGPRTDVADAEAALVVAKLKRAESRTAHKALFDEERRLRTRLRDASRAALHPNAPSLDERRERRAAALRELRTFRKSPEFLSAKNAHEDAATGVMAARARLTATATAGGKVDPAVWSVALPSLSDSQVLSLLGAFDRSGIADATRTQITERVASSQVAIPDVLRAARGATLAAAQTSGASSLSESRGASEWTSLPPSSWESSLETLVGSRVAEKLPEVKGRVLILVDGSGSMNSEVSGRKNDHRAQGYQSLTCADVAGFAAAAIASRCSTPPDVFVYDTSVIAVDELPGGVLAGSRSILGKVEGGGTDTHAAIASTWNDHDLLVILTDEQTSFVPGQPFSAPGYPADRDSAPRRSFRLPDEAKIVTVNLAGYAGSHLPDSENRRSISGWSEALFDEIRDMATVSPQAAKQQATLDRHAPSATLVACPYCEEQIETGSRYPEVQARVLGVHKVACPQKRFLGGTLEVQTGSIEDLLDLN